MTGAKDKPILLIGGDDHSRQTISAIINQSVPQIQLDQESDCLRGFDRLRLDEHAAGILILDEQGQSRLRQFLETTASRNVPPLLIIGDAPELTWLATLPGNRPDYLCRKDISAAVIQTALQCQETRRAALTWIDQRAARYPKTIEALLDVFLETDAVGRITEISPSIAEITGYSPAVLAGTRIQDLFADDMAADKLWQNLLASRRICDHEIRLKTTADRPVCCSASILLEEKGAAGLLRDISRRKLSGQEQKDHDLRLNQAQRMEAMATLAGGIAHDFNNILTAIKGYAELIHGECPPEGRLCHHAHEILAAVDRAQEMTRQIMTFSHRNKLGREPMEPHRVVKETIDRLRPALPGNVDIRENIAQDCGQILANPAHIQQVIMILCTNAAQAMPDGGAIEIMVSREVITAGKAAERPGLKEGANIRISVIDSGEGIPADIVEHIFEPFFTTRKKGEGAGLGLATAYGIITALDGHIAVESRPGSGARFDIFIPAIESEMRPVQDKTAEDESTPSGNGEHILLVDDEEAILQIGTQILSRLGYSVKTSSRPAEALAIFASDPKAFDLIITDQSMPKMSGVQLASEVYRIRPDVPVIMTSGHADFLKAENDSKTGITHFIEKPFRKKAISQAISRVLKNTARHDHPE